VPAESGSEEPSAGSESSTRGGVAPSGSGDAPQHLRGDAGGEAGGLEDAVADAAAVEAALAHAARDASEPGHVAGVLGLPEDLTGTALVRRLLQRYLFSGFF